MRAVAEATKASGRVPTAAEIDEMLDEQLLPARPPTSRPIGSSRTRPGGSSPPTRANYEADLHRVWETERPFELHLDGVTVTGRADVILDQEGGVPTALAIVDYKTSTHGEISDHALQLQVYADAGRREGLDVRAAYVHDLKAASRISVPVDPAAIDGAEATVSEAAMRIRARDYRPTPGTVPALRGPDDLRFARRRLRLPVRRRRPSSPRRRSR